MSMDEVIAVSPQPPAHLTYGTQVIPPRFAAVNEQDVKVHAQCPQGLHLRFDEAAVTRVGHSGPQVRDDKDVIRNHDDPAREAEIFRPAGYGVRPKAGVRIRLER